MRGELSAVTPRRVVITGVGVASALGFELEEFWRRLIAGESGIRRLPWLADDSPLPTQIAGWIDEEAVAAALARTQAEDPDRANQLALCVVGSGLTDAGWPTDASSSMEADLIVGTGHGNGGFQNACAQDFAARGYRKLRPTTVIRIMFNRPANLASIRYGLTGTSYVVSCACASGAVALAEAFYRVRFGLSELAVAACADTGLDPGTFAAWNRLGVLSKRAEPAAACRPFDRDRDGLVMGEGGASFVLETEAGARKRGARIYAEIAGVGMSCDAKHLVQPDSAGQVRAIRAALEMAGVNAAELDYVNAHGTATELADVVEAATLREILGPAAERIPVSNTKAQLGHLMGATAGVEVAATLLAMQRGLIPPCRNLDDPDPRCALGFVREEPRPAEIRVALKNCFAFGGTNCAVVLRRAGC